MDHADEPLLRGARANGGQNRGGGNVSAPIPRWDGQTPAQAAAQAKRRAEAEAGAKRAARGREELGDGDEFGDADGDATDAPWAEDDEDANATTTGLLRSILVGRLPHAGSAPRSWSTVDGLRSDDAQRLLTAVEAPTAGHFDLYEKFHRPTKQDVATGFSPFIGVCFTINFIIGSGFLGMPQAFAQSGVVLGFLLLLVFTLICNVTKDYILETMCRAEAVTEFAIKTSRTVSVMSQRRGVPDLSSVLRAEAGGSGALPPAPGTGSDVRRSFDDPAYSASGAIPDTGTELSNVSGSLPAYPGRSGSTTSADRLRALRTYTITQRKFELTELTELFLGPRARTAFIIIMSMSTIGTLWSYSSVFAASAAENIPLPFMSDPHTCNLGTDPEGCRSHYLVFLALFATIVVPLSCLELKEQVYVQVMMSMARFLVMGLLVFTVVFASTCDGTTFDKTQSHADDVTWFSVKGIGTMVPVAVYAQMFHTSIPVLSQPVNNKHALPAVFGWSFVITTVSYTAIGVVLAAYFGADVEGQCNLNWGAPTTYMGCVAPGEERPAWATMIGYFVLFFPALDVMSAFPLNAITLGNNLLSAWAGDRAPLVERDRKLVTLFRLAAALPGLIGAAVASNLDTILSFTGLIGLITTFYVPCLLVNAARKRCDVLFPDDRGMRTPYSSPMDFRSLWWLLLILTGIAGVFVTLQLVYTTAGLPFLGS